jgi:hypothetical protein
MLNYYKLKYYMFKKVKKVENLKFKMNLNNYNIIVGL